MDKKLRIFIFLISIYFIGIAIKYSNILIFSRSFFSIGKPCVVNEISIVMGQEILKSKLQGVVNLVKDKQQQNPDLFADAPSHSKSLAVVDVNQGKLMLQVKLLKLAEELKTKQQDVVPSSKSLR